MLVRIVVDVVGLIEVCDSRLELNTFWVVMVLVMALVVLTGASIVEVVVVAAIVVVELAAVVAFGAMVVEPD